MDSGRRFGSFVSLVGVALFAASGCSPDGGVADAPAGSAEVAVTALSASDVASMSVTVSAGDIVNPMVVALVAANGTWGGTVGKIPAGPGRTFALSARDAAGVEKYRGTALGVTITAGQTTMVIIHAQQVAPPPPFANAAPVLDALVASGAAVAPGEVINLSATAHDPNSGDTLSYTWTANPNMGSFSAAGASSTSWTAPATAGTVHLTVDVSDQKSAHATMSLDVLVASNSLVISPTTALVTAGNQVAFTATGGVAPYTWLFVANNSGGTLTTGGLYTAGFTIGVSDTLKVTDSTGGTATIAVTITAPLPVPAGGPVSVVFLAALLIVFGLRKIGQTLPTRKE